MYAAAGRRIARRGDVFRAGPLETFQRVYDKNGSGFFPIDERVIFETGDGISHTRFFGEPRVQEKIVEWLGKGAAGVSSRRRLPAAPP